MNSKHFARLISAHSERVLSTRLANGYVYTGRLNQGGRIKLDITDSGRAIFEVRSADAKSILIKEFSPDAFLTSVNDWLVRALEILK